MLLDLGLDAGFDASHPVSHRIDAILVRIGLFQRSELLLADVESLAPVDTFRFAGLYDLLLWVLSLGQHVLDIWVNPLYLSKLPCSVFIN